MTKYEKNKENNEAEKTPSKKKNKNVNNQQKTKKKNLNIDVSGEDENSEMLQNLMGQIEFYEDELNLLVEENK